MPPAAATAAASRSADRVARRTVATTHPSRGSASRPAAPRRVSGPARTPRPQVAGAAAITGSAPLAFRVVAVGDAIADSRVLDRLIRGRAWIAVIGVALLGIVFLQVSLLRMNAGIGESVQRASQLQRENGAYQAEISRKSAGQRIQDLAGRLGMVIPAAATQHYLSANSLVMANAIHGITKPRDTPVASAPDTSNIGIGTLADTTLDPAGTVPTIPTGTTGALGVTGMPGATGTTDTTAMTGVTGTTGTAGTTGTTTPSTTGQAVTPGTTSGTTDTAGATGAVTPPASNTTPTAGGMTAAANSTNMAVTGGTAVAGTQQTSTVSGGATAPGAGG